jgi:hypothetical protein
MGKKKVICKKITGHGVKILPKGVKKATSKALGSVKNLPTKYVLSMFLRMFLRRVEAGREAGSIFALRPLFSSNMNKCRKENRFKDKDPALVCEFIHHARIDDWEAIDKLRFLGYSVTLEEGKLRYAYQEEGNPPQDEIIPLLDTLKAPKGETGNLF